MAGSPARRASAVPDEFTQITGGSGVFTKQPATRWLRLTLVGGGGGGGGNPPTCTLFGDGGKAGACATYWLRATESTYAYSVGAGGVGGTQFTTTGGGVGGDTTFGPYTAVGGCGGSPGLSTGTNNGFTGESGPYGGGGGVAATAPNARGYGAGGGISFNAASSGGNGSGGLILIEEYA